MWNNARILRRVSSWLYAAVALLLIASAAVWLYRSSYFPVKQINIDGRLRHTDAGELQQVAQQYIRGNIFRADLNGAQAAFVKLPWIAKAEVRRRLPDTVDIRLTERIPVAHWDEGRLLDGTVFDSSYERKEPVTFKVTDVIPGWVEALQLMNEGSKYTLYIPSTLAYGETGAPPSIPPNATLTFDVELIKVGEAAKAEEKPADAKAEAKPEEAKKEEAKK